MSDAERPLGGREPVMNPLGNGIAGSDKLRGVIPPEAQTAPNQVAAPDGGVAIQKINGGDQIQTYAGTAVSETEPEPLWQPAETNQGLLSLIALVAALGFGLYEYRRNLRADDVGRREYIKMVIGVIDEILEFTSAIRARFDGGEDFQSCVQDWRDKIIAPRFLMDAVRSYPPGDALLAIEVNRLWASLQMSDIVDPAGSHASRLADMETNLKNSKSAIKARW